MFSEKYVPKMHTFLFSKNCRDLSFQDILMKLDSALGISPRDLQKKFHGNSYSGSPQTRSRPQIFIFEITA